MTKPIVVEKKQFDHMLRAVAGDGKARGFSQYPERDKAMLLVAYGTGMKTTELATITVRMYLTPAGAIKANSMIPIEIAFNGKARHVKWVAERLTEAVDRYLALRLQLKQGITVKAGAYRGLDPDSPIFLTGQGKPWELTKRVSETTGKIGYTCNSLAQHISKLHEDCGIVGGSMQSARRTFAVVAGRQHRSVFNVRNLAEALGTGVSAARRISNEDPQSLADVVRRSGGENSYL